MSSTLGLVLLLVMSSCGGSSHEDGHSPFSHESVLDKIRENEKELTYNVSSKTHIGSTKLVRADYDLSKQIFVPERTSILNGYPCNSCHTESIPKLKQGYDIQKAHWNINVLHAPANTMNCTTCHDDGNLNKLQSITSNEISLNQSYKLCAQCHSTQFNDWTGGSHGKKLGGWAPPTIKNNCVNCHDPHKPAFETRWPARLNTQKLIQLGE